MKKELRSGVGLAAAVLVALTSFSASAGSDSCGVSKFLAFFAGEDAVAAKAESDSSAKTSSASSCPITRFKEFFGFTEDSAEAPKASSCDRISEKFSAIAAKLRTHKDVAQTTEASGRAITPANAPTTDQAADAATAKRVADTAASKGTVTEACPAAAAVAKSESGDSCCKVSRSASNKSE